MRDTLKVNVWGGHARSWGGHGETQNHEFRVGRVEKVNVWDGHARSWGGHGETQNHKFRVRRVEKSMFGVDMRGHGADIVLGKRRNAKPQIPCETR